MDFICVQDDFTLCAICASGRNFLMKTFGATLLLASALAITAAPALALQAVVTQVDKNTDGSVTYHFAVKLDQSETLAPGASKATADFVTIYNFYGLVEGSAKSPAGWEFSSEEFGRTPTLNAIALPLTEAADASFATDQPSRARAERHWA